VASEQLKADKSPLVAEFELAREEWADRNPDGSGPGLLREPTRGSLVNEPVPPIGYLVEARAS
jgi:hypothetical protein